jgi:dipeptidyl aminopeptidase/acylaminoacyl peptidase
LDDYYKDDILQADLASELAARPLNTIFTADENQRLAAAARDGRCERVIYSSSGLRVAGFVLRPAAPGPHPVLIWLRGGIRDFGMIEPVTLLNLKLLADAGFVVVASQYRGADGSDGADEVGGADVDDVLALLPLARGLPGADADRLYLLGGSRGAMQGMLAMRRGLPVRAAAFRGGMFDLKATLAYRPELGKIWQALMPDQKDGVDQALERRSAVLWAGEVRAPILILHGRQDWRTRVGEAQAFNDALAKAGVPHKMVVYERDEHQLALHRPQWLNEAVQWFRAHGAFHSTPNP